MNPNNIDFDTNKNETDNQNNDKNINDKNINDKNINDKNINVKNFNVTFNNIETLIRDKKINFEDLKIHLNSAKLKNIYYEIVICNYFGYQKYIELVNYFNNKEIK